MENNNTNDFISTVIKKRKEVYYLVTEKDLNTLRTSSLLGDVSIIFASIILSGYFIDKSPYALFAGIVFILIAIGMYFFVFSQIKELKSSGEIKSLNIGSEIEKTVKKEYVQTSPDKEVVEKNKLIITNASYGTINRHKDVTDQIKKMVSGNKLITVASNKIAGDPHHGERKELLLYCTHILDNHIMWIFPPQARVV
ncbi:hypothetical protein L6267_03340 [Candidatus Parcubacteria bacterium]|nr:hypothetical protein [Candidatus Parcubacteria bacterium]